MRCMSKQAVRLQRGLTLIELMIVLSILGILMSIAMPIMRDLLMAGPAPASGTFGAAAQRMVNVLPAGSANSSAESSSGSGRVCINGAVYASASGRAPVQVFDASGLAIECK